MRRLPGFVVLARLGGETAERAGEVYRARRVATGDSVAIRVFPAADDSMAWSDVQGEIDLLSGISDPAVVAILEVIISDGVPHILSEYVPNRSVAELIGQRDEPLSIAEAVMVGERTAAALAAAHEVDVVHLGVTPHNVLIDASGQVKLADLGLSTLRQAGTHHPWAAARTEWYDTDEPAEQGHVESATDVLALGTMLSDLVRPAATDGTGPEGDVPADVTARLHRLIAACLDADLSARPSAVEARDELESIAADLGPLRCTAFVAAPPVKRKAARAPIAPSPAIVGYPPAAGVGYPPEDWPRRVGWRDAAAIVGFIVASVAGTAALVHRNSSHYFEYAAPSGAIATDADPDESETTDVPSTSLPERVTAPTTTDTGAGRGERPDVTTRRTLPTTSDSTSTTVAAAARSDRRVGLPTTTSPAVSPAPSPSTTTPSGPPPDPTTPPPTSTIPAPGPGPTTTTPGPGPGTTTTVPGPVPTTPPPTATTAPTTPPTTTTTTTSPPTSPPPTTTTTTTAPATTTTTAPPPLGLPLPILPPLLPPLPPLLP